LVIFYLKKKTRSHSPKINKSKKFKQENINYPTSTYLQLTDELLNHYMKSKQLETTYTLKWKLCQDLFSMFVGIVPGKIKLIKLFYYFIYLLFRFRCLFSWFKCKWICYRRYRC
jgi:hypothetical protein